MVYKDKDKQREAQRDWVRQKRATKGSTVTKADSHVDASDIGRTAMALYEVLSKPKRGLDIKCFEDLPLDVQATIVRMSTNEGKVDEAEKAKRTAAAIRYQHMFPDRYDNQGMPAELAAISIPDHVVIGKPGDADYNGICTPEWRADRGR